MRTKIVFVTGGVVSSLGKGIVASITGGLLKSRGVKVKIKKIDPYLNVDPGTLSPNEHGEVFITKDGAETDLDLGHYERLGGVETSKSDYITSGSIYYNIIKKERRGDYLGKTLQVIPHVTQEFQNAILKNAQDCDVLICEIGGTVGDIESIPILEAARQMRNSENYDVLFVHVALLPYLKKAGELKTKPIQHSVRTLLSFGIQCDMLLCRMEEKSDSNWKRKLALMCNINEANIFPALDAPSIYHAMVNYEQEGICKRVVELLDLKAKKEASIEYVKQFTQKLDENLCEVKIGIIGKYVQCSDAYKSLSEALLHAAISENHHVKMEWINSDDELDLTYLKTFDGILVPGGFGERGIQGKLEAIKFARTNDIPFFGICFGLQLAVIESLSQILNDVSSSEFGKCEHPVIARMEEWIKDETIIADKRNMGGTMRLGEYKCELVKNSLAHKIYNSDVVYERHRHRYEVNNEYRKYFEEAGLKISGECKGLVEIVEREDCKFFIAGQFHPEFQSNIQKPHPMFVEFIKAAIERREK